MEIVKSIQFKENHHETKGTYLAFAKATWQVSDDGNILAIHMKKDGMTRRACRSRVDAVIILADDTEILTADLFLVGTTDDPKKDITTLRYRTTFAMRLPKEPTGPVDVVIRASPSPTDDAAELAELKTYLESAAPPLSAEEKAKLYESDEADALPLPEDVEASEKTMSNNEAAFFLTAMLKED